MKAMTIVLDMTLCLFQMENVSWSLQIIYFTDSHLKKPVRIHDSCTICGVISFNAQYVFDVLVARTSLVCEQALRGAVAVDGKRKEGLQLRLSRWNLNSTANSPVASH